MEYFKGTMLSTVLYLGWVNALSKEGSGEEDKVCEAEVCVRLGILHCKESSVFRN